MKKKLFAIIAAVALIATLLVPMFSVNAADPKMVISLDTFVDEGEIAVVVNIAENTGDIFVAKVILDYDDSLKCTWFEPGDIEDEYDSGRGGMKSFGFNYTENLTEASVLLDSDWTTKDKDGNTYGVTTTGCIGTFYFAKKDGSAITDASAYSFGINAASEATSFDTNVHPNVSLLCKHTSTKEVVVSEAKCGVKGEKKTVCNTCGEDVQTGIEIPALDHSIVRDSANDVAAACGQPGTEAYKCDRAGCNYTETKATAALEHSIVRDPDNDVSSGCGQPGTEAYKCDRAGCNYTETKQTDALDHAWKEDTANSVAADCENEGVKAEVCERCGDTQTTKIDALGHDWEKDANKSVAPDCTEKGQDTFVCVRCGDEKVEDVAALGHDFSGEEEIVKEATEEEEGEKIVKCTRCDETETQVIPKKNKPVSPNTADTFATVAYVAVALIAVGAIAVIGKKRFAL